MFNKCLTIVSIVACCSLFAIGAKAEAVTHHQNTEAESATFDPNDGVPPVEISKGVSAVHVFVCRTLNDISPPDWLNYDALKKTALSYSKGHINIPTSVMVDARPCEEQRSTKQPNELNIVLSLIGQQENRSGGHSDLAILQRLFYRPAGAEGGITFQTKPVVLDLSDDKTARNEFQLWNWYWQDSKRHNNPLNADAFKIK